MNTHTYTRMAHNQRRCTHLHVTICAIKLYTHLHITRAHKTSSHADITDNRQRSPIADRLARHQIRDNTHQRPPRTGRTRTCKSQGRDQRADTKMTHASSNVLMQESPGNTMSAQGLLYASEEPAATTAPTELQVLPLSGWAVSELLLMLWMPWPAQGAVLL